MGETISEIVYRIAMEKTMAEDNWQHRSKHMRCSTCMHYCPKVSGNTNLEQRIAPGEYIEVSAAVIGRCRRHAPTMSGWPVMFPTDWCGDHKLSDEACMPTHIVNDDGKL